LNFRELEERTCLTISLPEKYVNMKSSVKGGLYVDDDDDDDDDLNDASFDKHLKR
jgi:hypothetical protein